MQIKTSKSKAACNVSEPSRGNFSDRQMPEAKGATMAMSPGETESRGCGREGDFRIGNSCRQQADELPCSMFCSEQDDVKLQKQSG